MAGVIPVLIVRNGASYESPVPAVSCPVPNDATLHENKQGVIDK